MARPRQYNPPGGTRIADRSISSAIKDIYDILNELAREQTALGTIARARLGSLEAVAGFTCGSAVIDAGATEVSVTPSPGIGVPLDCSTGCAVLLAAPSTGWGTATQFWVEPISSISFRISIDQVAGKPITFYWLVAKCKDPLSTGLLYFLAEKGGVWSIFSVDVEDIDNPVLTELFDVDQEYDRLLVDHAENICFLHDNAAGGKLRAYNLDGTNGTTLYSAGGDTQTDAIAINPLTKELYSFSSSTVISAWDYGWNSLRTVLTDASADFASVSNLFFDVYTGYIVGFRQEGATANSRIIHVQPTGLDASESELYAHNAPGTHWCTADDAAGLIWSHGQGTANYNKTTYTDEDNVTTNRWFWDTTVGYYMCMTADPAGARIFVANRGDYPIATSSGDQIGVMSYDQTNYQLLVDDTELGLSDLIKDIFFAIVPVT